MHISIANSFVQSLNTLKDNIQSLRIAALAHDSPALDEMLDEVQVQIDVPITWLRAAHHEGQKL